MYKSILFSLLLLLNGQINVSTVKDSLENLLDRSSSSIDKIDYNFGLARVYMLDLGDAQSGLDYAYAAKDEAQKIGSKKYEAIALTYIGMLHYNLSQPYTDFHEEGMRLALDSGDPDAIAFTHYAYTEILEFDFERGIQAMREIIDKYADRMSPKNLGNVYKTLSWQYEQNGDYELAEEANLRAIQIFKDFSNQLPIDPELGRVSAQYSDGGLENLFQVYVYTGDLYLKMGRPNDAIAMSLKAEEVVMRRSLKPIKAYLFRKQGGYYNEAGDYEKSINKYLESIKLFEELNEPNFKATAHSGLANLYLNIEELDLAKDELNKAIVLSEETPVKQVDYLVQLGYVLRQLDNFEDAVQTWQRADSTYATIGNLNKQTECKIQIANLKLEAGLLDDLDIELQEYVSVVESIKNYKLLNNLYMLLSKFYESKDELIEAVKYAKMALELCDGKITDLSFEESALRRLSHLEQKRSYFREALSYERSADIIQDSLYSINAIALAKAEQVKQNVDDFKLQTEAANQKARLLQSQNYLMLALAGALLSLFLAVSYFFIQVRKIRKQLEVQNVELKELNATKDRFFGIIAHDIRSPILALESVDRQMNYYVSNGDNEKIRKLSSLVGGTAQRLNRLLDNLLNWALLQTNTIPFNPERINLRILFDEILELFDANLKQKELQLTNKISSSEVIGDRNALSTIIRNLLSNAIKFSYEGGSIELQNESKNGEVSISIKDYGVGMEKIQQDQLFKINKKSKTGTKGEKGTGLGLILVKELTELNQGILRIDSEKGQGSKFTFTIPLAS